MPRTIDEGFRDFLTKLTPLPSESNAATQHRASIEACLKSNFGLHRFFRTGSFGNGTSIAGFSDVDYFASIPCDQLTENSLYSLRKIRSALRRRFPNTGVIVGNPAIKVPFGIYPSETTEVVPADYLGKTKSGYKVYDIADRVGGWRRSSPDAHNAFVRRVDKRLGGKARPLIRFIKAWKFLRDVPIQSFYLELRVAKYLTEESSIVYEIDVARILNWLDKNRLPAIQDPLGISGYIYPCTTAANLVTAKSRLETAATRARKAVLAEKCENTKLGFYWWNLLYRGKFPRYYK